MALFCIMRSVKQGWHFATLSLCVYVIPAYVNKAALLFCSALPQNLFRIRNLILLRALLALDQSAHLQIEMQINTAILRFLPFFKFFFNFLQFAENWHYLPLFLASQAWRTVGFRGMSDEALALLQAQCAWNCRSSKSKGYLPNFQSILWERPGHYSHP